MFAKCGSVLLLSIQVAIWVIDSFRSCLLPGSWHLVMCVDVSPFSPQLGHLSSTSLSHRALTDVHPHMPEACFVTQFLNLLG